MKTGLVRPRGGQPGSAKQLRDPNFADLVGEVLDRTGVDPSGLELEITESMVMGDWETAEQTLARIKSLGVKLSSMISEQATRR